MSRRDEWQKVLEIELQRWSALSYAQLVAALTDVDTYEVEFEGKRYQVEVEILERTEEYVHVDVRVDDGTLPASLVPAGESFIRPKGQPA